MKHSLLTFLFLVFAFVGIQAQRVLDMHNQLKPSGISKNSNDTTQKEKTPFGIKMWHINSRFGDTHNVSVDTLSHLFPNTSYTAGDFLQYNFLGNLGSPRISRLFFEQEIDMQRSPFIFTQPYNYFFSPLDSFYFTNTLSPYTNITYHSGGDKNQGDDNFKVLFATNINKRLGVGFKVNYLYGRGYYANQATSLLNGVFYGSYHGKQYQAHGVFHTANTKMMENGGITNDDFIVFPQNFSSNYGTNDIPTALSATWSRIRLFDVFFTQRYSLGFKKQVDAKGNTLKIEQQKGVFLADTLPQDTALKQTLSIQNDSASKDKDSLTTLFIPVTTFIHTLQVKNDLRRIQQNSLPKNYFSSILYGEKENYTYNPTTFRDIENLLGVEVNEGFNKWVKAGMKLYAKHNFRTYSLPTTTLKQTHFNENLITLGTQLYKKNGKLLHFDALGEISTTGSQWGLFNLEGDLDFSIPLRKDSLFIWGKARMANEEPSFYYQHFASRFAQWDNNLSPQFTTGLQGGLVYKYTALSIYAKTIQNYTYFAQTAKPFNEGQQSGFTQGITATQTKQNLRLFGLTWQQQIKWGVFHLETRLNYQTTSNPEVFPLPTFNAYANAYLKFKIAKVLGAELGVDGTYFTAYYAPTYSPITGTFATQASEIKNKVGNYPILNAYANFHLKRCRFYIAMTHINQSENGGRSFLVPHYPINPRLLHLGISWTFSN